MAARPTKLTLRAALLCLALAAALPDVAARPAAAATGGIVSLVPAVTEMLFAIGAGPQVVAVSSYDDYPPEVKPLPKVGALLDPDTERILSLRPELVIVYGSQSELAAQLPRAGIRVFGYRHGGITRTLDTIRELGDVTGHATRANALAASLRTQLDAVKATVAGRPRPRTMLVFERRPGTLRDVYASGGVGFLHEMLEIAGGVNVFADVKRESVQPSIETMLARAPEMILEVRAAGLNGDSDLRPWSVLASAPAVRNRRVQRLVGDFMVVPGPRLVMATQAFARALHPDLFR